MTIKHLFENNKAWADKINQEDPSFFKSLSLQQNPEYLWIGCSDSRVPANQLMGLMPGDVFVHRNVANVVVHADFNSLSVIHFAVEYLKVKHIIVCGHYGCGGIRAAMESKDLGILNPWLRNIRDVYRIHKKELDAISDEDKRYDRLVELNVQEQCINVIKTAEVQEAYRDRQIQVHGWVFDIHTGKLIDLKIDFEKYLEDIMKIYHLD